MRQLAQLLAGAFKSGLMHALTHDPHRATWHAHVPKHARAGTMGSPSYRVAGSLVGFASEVHRTALPNLVGRRRRQLPIQRICDGTLERFNPLNRLFRTKGVKTIGASYPDQR